jgi:DNA-binding MarR family transcriptional regulator
MSSKGLPPANTPCFCNALRQASRAVSRLYDDELRTVGLRTTQYTLLRVISQAGEVRQGDLSGLTVLEETTLTRNLRALVHRRWVAISAGTDRREKLVAITGEGIAKLKEARPAWARAQRRMRSLVGGGLWQNLLTVLPDVARSAVEA